MPNKSDTVESYLDGLSAERRAALQEVRREILRNLPEGYEEVMQYGMPSYVVPLRAYPKGYLGKKDVPLPYISIASQKSHMAIYFMGLYADREERQRFEREYAAAGKKLDMGKSCLRFKRVEDIPLDVIGRAVRSVPVRKLVSLYESSRSGGDRSSGGNARSRN